jgi:hypothetical protein
MKTSRRLVLSFAFLASAAEMLAHPGHDGHDLTWDFSHLAAYPMATAGCLAIAAMLGWIGWRMLRRSATERIQSLRGSQPSRGK